MSRYLEDSQKDELKHVTRLQNQLRVMSSLRRADVSGVVLAEQLHGVMRQLRQIQRELLRERLRLLMAHRRLSTAQRAEVMQLFYVLSNSK
jgi:hypothetical protein